MKKILEFILFSSIFIAACAVGFCIETNILLGLPLNSFSFYCFVFGATLLQYNLHYSTKKIAVNNSERLRWSLSNKKTHLFLLVVGALLILFSFFSFHLKHFLILGCLAAISFLYSFPFLPFGKKRRIKDYGLLKIVTLSLLWTLVTVWFPVNTVPVNSLLFAFVFVKRFIFMFILCLLFDVRDIEIDRREKINTLAVMLGKEQCYTLSYVLLLLFLAIALLQYLYLPQLSFFIAMIVSCLITFVVIQRTKKTNTDFIYLAGIDGMMLLQALLVYLFSLNL
ncbi:MAG: UbiA family prenyltransferase [Bacteroidota bacterium]|nr:UbiA family prenyltransferase [Bacteroidota bacterium]